MLVTQFDITAPGAQDEAIVSLTLTDRIVSFLCRLENGTREEDRSAALFRDALRQLARMPEFRSGQQHFAISDTLRRLAPAHLA